MESTNAKGAGDGAQGSRFVPDTVMAERIGVSVGFLQKDRRTARRIPFIQLGDRCLYDPPSVFEALKGYEVGGPNGARPGRIAKRQAG